MFQIVMFTMDTMEAPQPGTPGKDGEDEPSHNKLEDMIKELGTALTGNEKCLYRWYSFCPPSPILIIS